jgi:tetrahydromethanopterin S-methyltransferase subunit H
LEAANEAGIRNVLVDTAVLDVPSTGLSARAAYVIKSKYGLPVGCRSIAISKKEMGAYA